MVIAFSVCRALADQLEGNEEEQEKYRRMVVQYIVKNRDMFEPFIEDEVPFDEYCQTMEKDGTWAGHMELQAASLVTRNNICIHRHMSPRWYIRNFENQKTCMIHLSYHDGEHYNSVRLKEDLCSGPAKPIVIKGDVNLTASSQDAKSTGAQSKARTSKNVIYEGALNMVMAGSGCDDAEKVGQVLLQMDGDVDAAVEFLIEEQEVEELLEENGACHGSDRTENDESTYSEKQEVNRVSADGKDQPNHTETVDCDKISTKGDKWQKIPRNKLFAHVDQRRNIRRVVEQLLERPVLKLQSTLNLMLEGVKEGSKGRRFYQLPKPLPVNQMVNCLMWVHCVFDMEVLRID
ncbi:hypothetical protein BVRB_013000 isoform A [Beta vulgaris subsp. vulgaris]|uniref:OTU domain-containing protein n=1 Tax=Beta vulgaris subsp. vulgaris TaxID=3555 RepID=A0A0J8B244_BETVV|nr:hypothetical protein BVRB_013000 isoform A [Beta vulgaris subsp. vulgaris]